MLKPSLFLGLAIVLLAAPAATAKGDRQLADAAALVEQLSKGGQAPLAKDFLKAWRARHPGAKAVAFDDFPGGYPDAKQALQHPTRADLQPVKWRAGALYYARILPTPKGAWLAFSPQKGKPVPARRYVLGLYDARGNAWAAAQGGR